MKTSSFAFSACFLLALLCSLTAYGQTTDELITKARAQIGSETILTALRSVHYTGTLETVEVDAEGREQPVSVRIDIIFAKPLRQRIVTTSEKKIEVTALDGYDGWQREEDAQNADNWRMNLMAAPQVKRLRANTWENLAFFRGIERQGGRVDDLGEATVEGVVCRKLAFVHAPNIIFYRYFDRATGKLMLSETESGGTIREEGSLKSGGLNFPQKIITTNTLSDGRVRTMTITFSAVTLNEDFPASLFEVPALRKE